MTQQGILVEHAGAADAEAIVSLIGDLLEEIERTLAFYERQGFSIIGGRKCKQEMHR